MIYTSKFFVVFFLLLLPTKFTSSILIVCEKIQFTVRRKAAAVVTVTVIDITTAVARTNTSIAAAAAVVTRNDPETIVVMTIEAPRNHGKTMIPLQTNDPKNDMTNFPMFFLVYFIENKLPNQQAKPHRKTDKTIYRHLRLMNKIYWITLHTYHFSFFKFIANNTNLNFW